MTAVGVCLLGDYGRRRSRRGRRGHLGTRLLVHPRIYDLDRLERELKLTHKVLGDLGVLACDHLLHVAVELV